MSFFSFFSRRWNVRQIDVIKILRDLPGHHWNEDCLACHTQCDAERLLMFNAITGDLCHSHILQMKIDDHHYIVYHIMYKNDWHSTYVIMLCNRHTGMIHAFFSNACKKDGKILPSLLELNKHQYIDTTNI